MNAVLSSSMNIRVNTIKETTLNALGPPQVKCELITDN